MGVDVKGNRLLYTGNSAKEKAVMRLVSSPSHLGGSLTDIS
jgi:hypothetical protein